MASAFVSAFDQLYACQTRNLGVAIIATVADVGTDKAALLSVVDETDNYGAGTTMVTGGFMLQIKQTDLSADPPKNAAVTCNGSATGLTLQVVSFRLVNGIYEITAGDINA